MKNDVNYIARSHILRNREVDMRIQQKKIHNHNAFDCGRCANTFLYMNAFTYAEIVSEMLKRYLIN